MGIGLFQRETIVLPQSATVIAEKLWWATKPPHAVREDGTSFLFNGWVDEKDFEISRIIAHPENYLPLISGKIEPTSTGCILFVRYQLFFSTIMFLSFSSAFCLLFSIFLLAFAQEYLYGVLTFLLGIANYAIAIANFNLQVKKSKALLNDLLLS